jgi:hypothetical protein
MTFARWRLVCLPYIYECARTRRAWNRAMLTNKNVFIRAICSGCTAKAVATSKTFVGQGFPSMQYTKLRKMVLARVQLGSPSSLSTVIACRSWLRPDSVGCTMCGVLHKEGLNNGQLPGDADSGLKAKRKSRSLNKAKPVLAQPAWLLRSPRSVREGVGASGS